MKIFSKIISENSILNLDCIPEIYFLLLVLCGTLILLLLFILAIFPLYSYLLKTGLSCSQRHLIHAPLSNGDPLVSETGERTVILLVPSVNIRSSLWCHHSASSLKFTLFVHKTHLRFSHTSSILHL